MDVAKTQERPWLAGALLIGIGLFLLAVQYVRVSGPLVLAALAVFFLILYIGTGRSGFVIPGLIIGGLAVGVAFEQAGYGAHGGAVVLGLASGFLAIYVFNVFTGHGRFWWPIVPGGVLALVGGSQAIGESEAADLIGRWWPAVLILVGIVVLLGNISSPRRTERPQP